jgi:multiple sugar transport system substrate-binding protein
MKVKKIISLLIGASIVLSMFSACSSKDTSAKPEEKGNVTLVYGVWDKNQEPIMRQLADKFQETHKNIKIDIQLTPYKQYWTKLETEATGGNLPDVFWMNGPNIAKYAGGKMLLPITDNIKKDNLNLNEFPKALIDLYTVDGKQYGIPKDWDTTAIWYNKKIFDDAKVPYPTSDWDWNKMREIAKRLTDKSKGIYGVAAAQDDQSGYYNTIPSAGGFIISEDRKKSGYDQPGAVEGIQCWIDLIKDGSSPTAQQMTETLAQDLFVSGKVAMTFQGSWMVPQFMNNDQVKDHIDIVSMPKLKQNAAIIHGLSNVIYSKTKYPQESWEFVKYLAGKEANETIAKSGVVIPAYTPALQIFIDSYKNVNLKAYTDELNYSVMYPVSKNTSKWVTIQDDNLKKVWAGQMSAEEACKAIADGMNKALQEEK